MDDYGVQWWSVGAIKSLADECPGGSLERGLGVIMAEGNQYLICADFLLWCYAWAICCSDGANHGRIALIGGGPDGFVANDIRTFVRHALLDSIDIHSAPRA